MQVKMINDGIIILPETEFEEDYLFFNFQDKPLAFLKCGIISKNIIGIKIKSSKKPTNNEY